MSDARPPTSAQLRAVRMTVQEGGIGAAARALGLSQPTISAQLSALEGEYGVRLVDRATGRPTAVGARLVELAIPLSRLEDAAGEALRAAKGTGDGSLRVVADAPSHVMPVLARIRREHPALILDVRTMNSRDGLLRLRRGEADLLVAAEVPPDPDLHHGVLQSQDLAAVVRSDHPWSDRRTLPLAELHGQDLVGREEGSLTWSIVEAHRPPGSSPWRVRTRAHGRETMLAAVIAGLGIGVIAEDEILDDPRLVMLDLREPRLTITEHLVCARHRRDEPVLRAAFSYLEERGT